MAIHLHGQHMRARTFRFSAAHASRQPFPGYSAKARCRNQRDSESDRSDHVAPRTAFRQSSGCSAMASRHIPQRHIANGGGHLNPPEAITLRRLRPLLFRFLRSKAKNDSKATSGQIHRISLCPKGSPHVGGRSPPLMKGALPPRRGYSICFANLALRRPRYSAVPRPGTYSRVPSAPSSASSFAFLSTPPA